MTIKDHPKQAFQVHFVHQLTCLWVKLLLWMMEDLYNHPGHHIAAAAAAAGAWSSPASSIL